MKIEMNYLLIVIFLLTVEVVSAQKSINAEDMKGSLIDYKDYLIKDPRLDDFVGIWELRFGDSTLVLELEKKENYNLLNDLKLDITLDIIQARYLLKQNETTNHNWEQDLFIKLGRIDSKRILRFNIVDNYSGLIYSARIVLDKKNPHKARIKFGQTEALTILGNNGRPKPRPMGVKFQNGIVNLNDKVFTRVLKD